MRSFSQLINLSIVENIPFIALGTQLI